MDSRFPHDISYVTECGGAWLRTQRRGVAVRIEVRGRVDASNSDKVAELLLRYCSSGVPLIVDCIAAHLYDDALSMLTEFDSACRANEVEWLLVADLADRHAVGQSTASIPLASSLHDALQLLTQAATNRQQPIGQPPRILPGDDGMDSSSGGLEMDRGLDRC